MPGNPQCESIAGALGVEATPILEVAVDELRVLALGAEDSAGVGWAGQRYRLGSGCLHTPTVGHLGDRDIGRTSRIVALRKS